MASSCLNRPDAWLWGGIHILLTAALPTLYIVYLYRQGRVSDPHLNVRSERFRPLVAALLTSPLSLGLLYSASAPRLLVLLAALNLIQLVLDLCQSRLSGMTATIWIAPYPSYGRGKNKAIGRGIRLRKVRAAQVASEHGPSVSE